MSDAHRMDVMIPGVHDFKTNRFPPSCVKGKIERIPLKLRRILSSTPGSEPFGKFSTLLDSSTGYKNADWSRYDPS
jgi:hypothetical protein